MKLNLSELRKNYVAGHLNRWDLPDDPVVLFGHWFRKAAEANVPEPNAMVLSTANDAGLPSSRVVLLKEFGSGGFTFYTNYLSRKGSDMMANPHVALLFSWLTLERQVRIEGIATKTSAEESDTYFHSRPEGSRLGAWASEQSRPIAERGVLEERLEQFRQQFGNTIPRPEHWGGYVVKPTLFEFWQGRSDRLHDRFSYTYSEQEENWQLQRLAP